MDNTRDPAYAKRLRRLERVWWKRLLNVQAPYQWNLRRQHLGRTLDIGCGIGRNLVSLDTGSIGVDHNRDSVAVARERGLVALTVEEWSDSEHRVPATFDSLLLAHVIEHMSIDEGHALLMEYLPYVKPGGKVFFVCPQERGFASDGTHVQFVDGEDLTALARRCGLQSGTWYSFPFPRWAGRFFTHNEFRLLARCPS